MTPDDTPRDAGEDTRERTEHIARVLHDAATGRITPDPADPTPYGRMAARVHDEVVAPLVERLRRARLDAMHAEQREAMKQSELSAALDRLDDLELERNAALNDLEQRAVILPDDWARIIESVIKTAHDGIFPGFDHTPMTALAARLVYGKIESWRGVAAQPAQPTPPKFKETGENLNSAAGNAREPEPSRDGAITLCPLDQGHAGDCVPERTFVDWCPNCRAVAGHNRMHDGATQRCGSCGTELDTKPVDHLGPWEHVGDIDAPPGGFDRTAAHSEHAAEQAEAAPPVPQAETTAFRSWLCPNNRCEHSSVAHDVSGDPEDPRPMCTMDGCACGRVSDDKEDNRG